MGRTNQCLLEGCPKFPHQRQLSPDVGVAIVAVVEVPELVFPVLFAEACLDDYEMGVA